MKISLKKFINFFLKSAWYYSRPILAFDNFYNWSILVFGIIIASIVGKFLISQGELAFTLVNVGSFLGTIICVLPRHSHPWISSVNGIILVGIGSAIGILLHDNPLITFILFCLSLYITGLTRNFSIGMFVKCLFCSVAILAGGELRGTFPIFKVWEGLLAVLIGMAIVNFFYCLFSRHEGSIQLIIELYEELYRIAKDENSKYIHVRTKIRENIEVMPRIYFVKTPWIFDLINQADRIAGSLRWSSNYENSNALRKIISILESREFEYDGSFSSIDTTIEEALTLLKSDDHKKISILKSVFPTKEGLNELREIFASFKGSSSRFAIRLVFTGFFCHIFSIIIDQIYPLPLAGHEFWVVISGCLMVMPGSHGTMGKITSRTIGSILGAIVGVTLCNALPQINNTNNILHIVIACFLIIGYETVRKMSQAILMFSVTLWLTFVLGGISAGFTRVFDVIVGALIAFIIFFVFPTWHDQILRNNIEKWISTIDILLSENLLKKNHELTKKIHLMNAYRVQGRIQKSIGELLLEYAVYNSIVQTDNLLKIDEYMGDIILQIIQIKYYLLNNQTMYKFVEEEIRDYRNRILHLTTSSCIDGYELNRKKREFPFLDQSIAELEKLLEQF